MTPPGPRARLGVAGRVGRARDAAALLLRLGADAQGAANFRRGVHARRVAGHRSRRGTRAPARGGLDAAFERHVRLGRACREGIKAMGLELFSPDDDSAAVVTAVRAPEGIDSGAAAPAARPPRRHARARPGRAQGEDLPHRPHRLLRRLRHRDGARRGRALARASSARTSSAASRSRARSRRSSTSRLRSCLVREPIAEAGIDLLRERFDVDVDGESDLAEIIGLYDGIVIRSATKLTRELIERAEQLKVIGRAGVGVDNVDVEAATRRGSSSRTLPSRRSSPPPSTRSGCCSPSRGTSRRRTRRCRTGGGSGRGSEGSSSPARRSASSASGASASRSRAARSASRCASSPTTRSSRRNGFRELGVERVETPEELYAAADFVTLHLPLTEETRHSIDAEAIAKMRDGVRIVNAARGELVDEAALLERSSPGRSRPPRSTCSTTSRTPARCSSSTT